jgi:pimeloyl-ACP methyl ester carboxylesterase
VRRSTFAASLVAVAGALRALPARATDADYALTTPTGTIAGTLDLPPNAKPPVVIVIAGSGPVDRDGNAGNALRTDTSKLLGAALVARGIACIRYDKRGIGASKAAAPASETQLRLATYVDDAAAWIAKARADGRFGRVAVAGHSEGALIGMLAAQQARVDAFISLEGPGRPLGDVLRAQLGDRLLSNPPLLTAATHILDQLEAGHTVADVPPELMGLFAPAVQPYLISELDDDPTREIAKVRATIAIVQGTYDQQVGVDDAKRLAAAVPAARLTIVPGMAHPLKIAASNVLAEQISTVYADPTLPIAPAVVDAIAASLA